MVSPSSGGFRGRVDTGKLHIKGFEETPLETKVAAQSIKMRFFSWVSSLFSDKKFVELNVNDKPVLVKVNSLVSKLGLSRKAVVSGSDSGKLEGLVKQSLVKKKSRTLANRSIRHLTSYPDTHTSIRTIIAKMCQILIEQPESKVGGSASQVISLGEEHKILIEDSPEGLKITTLFGKTLGAGTFGRAIHTVDLMKGEWSSGKRSVIKLPSKEASAERQLWSEAKILGQIHEDGEELGIQKPVTYIGGTQPLHYGEKYDADLLAAITERSLSPADKGRAAYQIACGVHTMHAKGVTHGDIKPGNIFCDLRKETTEGVDLMRAYVADFGDAVNHNVRRTVPKWTGVRTPEYSVKGDVVESKKAHTAATKASPFNVSYKNKCLEKYKSIEKKSDVFALSSTIASIYLGDYPYTGVPYEGRFELIQGLEEQLIEKGLNKKAAQLIIQGLSADYHKRPSAEQIRDAFHSQVSGRDFSRIPKMSEEEAQNKLQNRSVGSYFLRRDGDYLGVSVMTKNGVIHHQQEMETPASRTGYMITAFCRSHSKEWGLKREVS